MDLERGIQAEPARERETRVAVSLKPQRGVSGGTSPSSLHLDSERSGTEANGFVPLLQSPHLRYCLLHGWRPTLGRPPSDIDIAIDPGDLAHLEGTLQGRSGGQLVQLLQHESSCYYFVLAIRDGATVEFIAIDAAVDYRRDGYVFFTAKQLLGDRRYVDGLWVAAPATEFAYLLVKKVSKGRLPAHQKARLQSLSESLGKDARVIACRMFGAARGNRAVDWLAQSDWAALEAGLPRLRRALRYQLIARDPLNPIRYWLPELLRRWRRWRYPPGLSVAVLGSDGSGKSTFLARLRTEVTGAFRRTAAFHLYPRLRERGNTHRAATDPHGKPPYPLWLSLLKVPYYVAIYGLGYLFGVRPRLSRATLVLFDRYYHDLLVDPRRYRYGGSMRLAALARHLVPRPDLCFILDVPDQQLLHRKREVSAEELRRQRKAYVALAADLPGAVLLDGTLPPDEVTRQGSDVILDYLHQRYIGRRPPLYNGCASDALDWMAGILCPPGDHGEFVRCHAPQRCPPSGRAVDSMFAWLSLKDGRGYLIPLDSRRAATKALDLYNTQSLKARLAKGLLAAGLRWGAGKRLLPRVQFVSQRASTDAPGPGPSFLEYLQDVLKREDLRIAISLGTPGPHRKPVFLVLTAKGETLAYAKLGSEGSTDDLIDHESEVLDRLARRPFRSFTPPRILHSGSWNGRRVCIQSAPATNTAPASSDFHPHYLEVIRELVAFHTQRLPLRESEIWKRIPQRIQMIPNSWYRHTLERGLRAAEARANGALVPFHFSHGDFVPWNAKWDGERLFLFDWEYAAEAGVPGGDVFHFLFHTMRLFQRRGPSEILRAFLTEGPLRERIRICLTDLGLSGVPQEFCLLLYCLEWLSRRIPAAPGTAAEQQDVRAFANAVHALSGG